MNYKIPSIIVNHLFTSPLGLWFYIKQKKVVTIAFSIKLPLNFLRKVYVKQEQYLLSKHLPQ